MKHRVEKSFSDNSTLHAQLLATEDVRKQVSAELESSISRMAELEAAHEHAMEKFADEYERRNSEALREQEITSEVLRRELFEQVQELKERIAIGDTALLSRAEEIRELGSNLAGLQAERLVQDEKLLAVTGELADKCTQLVLRESEIEVVEKELADNEVELISRDAEILSLKTEVEKSECLVRTHFEQILELENELGSANIQRGASEDTIKRLSLSVAELGEEIVELKGQLVAREAQEDEVRCERLVHLERKLVDKDARHESREEEMDALKKELSNYEALADARQEEISQLKRYLNESETLFETLRCNSGRFLFFTLDIFIFCTI